MSNEEMNIAVAEAMGWTGCYATERYVTGIDPIGIERDIPNYCNDLNACREMERDGLKDWSERRAYASHLYDAPVTHVDSCWESAHASAERRVRAFLAVKETSPHGLRGGADHGNSRT